MTAIDYNLQCSQCAGDLRGAELHGACPHCRVEVAATVNTSALDAETHTVKTDVDCIGCGYNVRSLRLRGQCPECGLEVLESVRSSDLRHADVSWLNQISRGVMILLIAGSAILPLFFAMTFGARIAAELLSAPSAKVVSAVVAIVCMALVLSGAVRASGVDPDPRTPQAVCVAGRIVRWGCVATILVPILSWLFWTLTAGNVLSPICFLITPIAIIIAMSCVFVSLLYCLRHVAERGASPDLRKGTTVLMWFVGTLGALTALTVLTLVGATIVPRVNAFAAPAGGLAVATGFLDGVRVVLGFLMGVTYGILAPVCMIYSVVLLFKYRILLDEAIARSSSRTDPHALGGANPPTQGNSRKT